ncbi:hypothetical protein D3C79_845430 [compost metagenome]
MNLGILSQDGGRIQGRSNHDLGVVDAWIAEFREALEGVAENFLQVEVQFFLRGIERFERCMVVATLLQITVIETAQTSRQALGAVGAASVRVIEVPLRTQEVHPHQRLENGGATRLVA